MRDIRVIVTFGTFRRLARCTCHRRASQVVVLESLGGLAKGDERWTVAAGGRIAAAGGLDRALSPAAAPLTAGRCDCRRTAEALTASQNEHHQNDGGGRGDHDL